MAIPYRSTSIGKRATPFQRKYPSRSEWRLIRAQNLWRTRPKHPHYLGISTSLIQNLGEAIKKSNDVLVIGGFVGDRHLGLVGSNHCVVANRLYVYLEDEPTEGDAATLDALCKSKGLWLTVRAVEYVKKKTELEKPLAFISHDSRDKTEVAGPIAIGLQRMLCPVWYDEFSLKVGDHLRESIERGLKETKKCILILSPNFFSNNGWTKTEFNSVFTRELIETRPRTCCRRSPRRRRSPVPGRPPATSPSWGRSAAVPRWARAGSR